MKDRAILQGVIGYERYEIGTLVTKQVPGDRGK